MKRKDKLYSYSEFSVNFKISKELIVHDMISSLDSCQYYIDREGMTEVMYYYYLNKWESEYFGINSIVLKFIDFDEIKSLTVESITRFIKNLKGSFKEFIISIEIPSDDNLVLQILNESGFRLIETRLHYYKNDLHNFNEPHVKVREASKKDIDNLKKIASFMRNDFDRFHSDSSFDGEIADSYLSTYIENSINGFVDLVIVPDEKGLPSDSFLTANYLMDKWKSIDHPISKMVLSAVSSITNKGWYINLISEMTHLLKEKGAETIYMNTQSTNIPVLYTWEKLGYHIGRSTHLFSIKIK
jgi:dTDP-4-amino-4,6-dideoxy-D-galactose acyltransferase